MPAVSIPPSAGERDSAELIVVEILFFRLQIVLRGTLLHADLAHAIVLTRRFDNQRSFIDRSSKRLLDIDVAAGVQRVNRDRRVPVIRSGNQHGIDLLALEQLAMVTEGLRLRG